MFPCYTRSSNEKDRNRKAEYTQPTNVKIYKLMLDFVINDRVHYCQQPCTECETHT